MNKIKRIVVNAGSTTAYGIITAIFMFVPEDVFKSGFIQCDWSVSAIIVVNRIIFSIIILVLANIIYYFLHKCRKSVTVADNSCFIQVEYGDILKVEGGKKVINFDECFTTFVGERPQDIKPESICGQYLGNYPISEETMRLLILESGIQSTGRSQYNNLPKYEPGTLIPKDDYLLMAFAILDKNGLGKMTYNQYLKCLNKLWQQIDLYHGTKDVYVPVLGSKIVRFVDKELTQQDLLDTMISSYRLNTKRLKKPYKLHIVCKQREGFSINNVFGIE